MTELIQKKLSDSTGARWTALLIVAFTMMMGYFITDVMSPLEVHQRVPFNALLWRNYPRQDGHPLHRHHGLQPHGYWSVD